MAGVSCRFKAAVLKKLSAMAADVIEVVSSVLVIMVSVGLSVGVMEVALCDGPSIIKVFLLLAARRSSIFFTHLVVGVSATPNLFVRGVLM